MWEKRRNQACLIFDQRSAMETDFHTKSRLSLFAWGSLWYENRANPFCSDGCHVFILPTRCPFINLWLQLVLCLKRLVLNRLMPDCCCCTSGMTCTVSHRSFKVLSGTKVTLCNPQLPAGCVYSSIPVNFNDICLKNCCSYGYIDYSFFYFDPNTVSHRCKEKKLTAKQKKKS